MPDAAVLDAALASVSAVTVMPFTDTDRVDLDAHQRLVDRLASAAVGTITVNGNAGEYGSLTPAERRDAVRASVAAAQATTVIAGIGGDVLSAIDDARDAAAAGARLIMIHQPQHPYRSLAGWVEYHRAIAAAVDDVAVVLYLRDPSISVSALQTLAEQAPNVVAAKYAIPDPMTLTRLTMSRDLPWRWLCGLAEPWAHVFWAAGARGFTSGLANVEPTIPLAYLQALRQQDLLHIRALWDAIQPFERLRAANAGANSVGVLKDALVQRGWLVTNRVRPPLTCLDDRDRHAVSIALDELAAWSSKLSARAAEARV